MVVNKFTLIDYGDNKFIHVYDAKQGKYNKNCQDLLRVLKSDYYDEYDGITIPKGTVTYMGRPVALAQNKTDYEYQIKTTGESFSGCNMQMLDMLKIIINLINQDKEKGGE